MERPDQALEPAERRVRTPWFTRDVLGQPVLLKRMIMTAVNLAFYPIFRWRHPLTVRGIEHLTGLPPRGVLFVSNHQTYFTDAIAMHQVFSAALAGRGGVAGHPGYTLQPHTGMFYVAARETMASGWIPRLLACGGAICVDRSWKEGETLVQRGVDPTGFSDIGRALSEGLGHQLSPGHNTPLRPRASRRGPHHPRVPAPGGACGRGGLSGGLQQDRPGGVEERPRGEPPLQGSPGAPTRHARAARRHPGGH